MTYSYARYLRAKRTVDDRALNRGVMDAALQRLPQDRPVRIAELGGGVGTMVDRLVECSRITQAQYVLVDVEAPFLDEAKTRVDGWARGETRHGAREGVSFDVRTRHARIEDWVDDPGGTYDLIIAHAVLDLVDVPTVLPRLLATLTDGGTFWTTINFDGNTIFMPRDPRDVPIIDAYHQSMDDRDGSSTAGRELFGHIHAAGGTVVRSGSSSWVVHPGGAGYEGDEAYFVHHIVHTVEQELGEHPQLGPDVQAWGTKRHAQIDANELVYIAHQLDFAVGR
ncbi:MAG: class I SAM-dependent methyltransferase [Myxococcota bacterium]